MSEKAVLVVLGCVLAVLVSVLVGAGAGYLSRRTGATYPAAVLQAGAAFAATLGVVAAVTAALTAVAVLLQ
ncbi:hypothetical protein [Streptomyces sp. PAN_FS17]|uniref:hypothetical protein n=1 Tax=Streptomyces sp. PAN_FS17 TaxID=1855351 RepID=UPI00089A25FE|nr:hypothetical protein [Streptomyces sp. PAN_FS17]SEB60097.1 hypothetical protein SAMN05216482_0138 [Streptomyces sp. PAN_FS17]